MQVLVLEASTSAAKAMVYDSGAGIVSTHSKPYGPQIDSGARQDTDGVYRAVLAAGREVAAGREIAAVALGGVWHSIAVCGEDMSPVCPTHVWTFTGASPICKSIREDKALTREIYHNTGCMPNITYPPYNILYLRKNGMDLAGKKLMSQGCYHFYQMTGEWLEAASMVSGMGMLNTWQRQYDEKMLQLLGITVDQLPPLTDYRDTRPLLAGAAEALGIPPGIPVVPAHPDGALNQVGSSAGAPGRMTLSIGTSAAIRMSSEKPALSEEGANWCYVGTEGWMCGGATNGACNCVNWFKETALDGKWSFKELDAGLLEDRETPVFLPFLFGERCPGWRDERTGGFHRVRPEAGPLDLYRAVCEGVLYNIYQCYQALIPLTGEPEEIIVSGGVLNSPQWTQMVADLFQRPIILSDSEHASVLGGAVLALCAAGAIDSPAAFSGGRGKTLPPQITDNRYHRRYKAYLSCYQSGTN